MSHPDDVRQQPLIGRPEAPHGEPAPRIPDPSDLGSPEAALEWLSARSIELVGFPPERDLYEFICTGVKELVGNAIVGVNSIDPEADVLRVRRLAGIGHTRLRRVEELLQKKVIGSAFGGVDEEAKRELGSGTLCEIEGGLYRMFFRRVPRPVCFALEKLLGVRSVHSIGLRRNNRLLGNVTILALRGARLNRSVLEAFVNQASAALERQLAEAEACQADENLEIVAGNVTDLVWMASFRGIEEISPETFAGRELDAETLLGRWQFTFVSPSAERVLGYHPEVLRQLGLRDLLTESAWVGVCERFGEELAAALADPAYCQPAHPIEAEHVGGDGRPRWCEVTARFLRNERSKIVGVLGVTRDVDRRRQETAALREERNRLGRLLEMHERDRKLVAYEIHDGFVQSVTAALMHLESHLRMLGTEVPAATAEQAQTAGRLLAEGIAEARRLMGGLCPPSLEDRGVVAALENLVADQRTADGPAIEFSHDVRFDRLAAPLETAVFRVAQEALANALRHAKTDRISVRLVQQDERIRIEVRDHGVGFDPTRVAPTGFGLDGIRQRARLFDGHVQIDSRPGRGTRITVELPLVRAGADSPPPAAHS
jgi:PAS domain S-box-containing protein